MMSMLLALVAVAPIAVAIIAYAIYPAALWVVTLRRKDTGAGVQPKTWPTLTITVPVYNAASSIELTLSALLALDYPKDRLQILVISDASNDGTDAIVQSFADRGVELLRMPVRRGKTVAENAALSVSRGDILVNVDSTILVPPDSLKKLIAPFADPTIGVASGRDVSVGDQNKTATHAESRYVGYEMWVRDLETRAGSIVGASGCFYAARRSIHEANLPAGLSWDFASALNAQAERYRSISVREAICYVPRTAQIRTELKRKARTMARGLSTLFYYRELMNPRQHGWFAVALICHKLLRWIPYLLAPAAYIALGTLAAFDPVAMSLFVLVTIGVLLGITGIRWRRRAAPRVIALAGFLLAVFSAGFLAWYYALLDEPLATWEPTTRPQTRSLDNQEGLNPQISV
ncbi:MAG TPA: glycosyltransferase [Gemmatimonadaceae bacterium]|nr:glycosyltransferase [Gemmatimonadaceae bacterium]